MIEPTRRPGRPRKYPPGPLTNKQRQAGQPEQISVHATKEEVELLDSVAKQFGMTKRDAIFMALRAFSSVEEVTVSETETTTKTYTFKRKGGAATPAPDGD